MKGRLAISAYCLSIAIGSQAELASVSCVEINIPASNAATAIEHLALQTGIKVLFSYDRVKLWHTDALVGCYTTRQALNELLKRSGLEVVVAEDGVFAILEKEAGQAASP